MLYSTTWIEKEDFSGKLFDTGMNAGRFRSIQNPSSAVQPSQEFGFY